MKRLILTILAFVVVTFGVQGMSHFIINVDHFAAIAFMRPEPVLQLGFAAMIVQALVLSFAMSRLWPEGATIRQAFTVSACFGVFLASYIVLASPAKYAVPSIAAWMSIEGIASFTQFSLFGVLLGLIYRKRATS